MLIIYHETELEVYDHDEGDAEPHEHWHILEAHTEKGTIWASNYDMGYHSPEEVQEHFERFPQSGY